jgi:hypothetical protein
MMVTEAILDIVGAICVITLIALAIIYFNYYRCWTQLN